MVNYGYSDIRRSQICHHIHFLGLILFKINAGKIFVFFFIDAQRVPPAMPFGPRKKLGTFDLLMMIYSLPPQVR